MKSPTPEQVRKARETAGLSVADAAKLIYKSEKGWRKWEAGERKMDLAYWTLFRLRIGVITIEQIARH